MSVKINESGQIIVTSEGNYSQRSGIENYHNRLNPVYQMRHT